MKVINVYKDGVVKYKWAPITETETAEVEGLSWANYHTARGTFGALGSFTIRTEDDVIDYKALREKEYLKIQSDTIEALIESASGDSTKLDSILDKRNQIKQAYPKPQDKIKI